MTLPLGTVLAVDGLPDLSDGQSNPWAVVRIVGHFVGVEELGPEPVVEPWDRFLHFEPEDDVDTAPKAVSPETLATLGYFEIRPEDAPARLKGPA